MSPFARIVASALGLICCCSNLVADSLPGQLHQAAKKISTVLLERDQDKLAMGQFDHAAGGTNFYGPGLRVDLAASFGELSQSSEQSISLTNRSSYVLSGTYQVMDDPEDALAPQKGLPQMLVIKIDLVVKQNNEVVFPITLFVDRIRDIAKAKGASGLFRLDDSTRKLHEQIRIKSTKPTVAIDGTRIKSSLHSDVSAEVLTKSVLAANDAKATARIPLSRAGVPVVPIAVGEVYEVQIHNDSSDEIAVAMTIDGIDQFSFSEDRDPGTGRPKFSHWIIPAKKSFNILGWHRTADRKRDDNVLRFLVTQYGDGASQFAPQADRSTVGLIQLSISKSHPHRRGARGDSETGFGPPVKQEQKSVRREIDPPHEFISIRYTR